MNCEKNDNFHDNFADSKRASCYWSVCFHWYDILNAFPNSCYFPSLQAKLLSMTRGTAVSRVHGGSRSPENVFRRQETSTPSAAHLNKAFTKTVVNKPASKSNYSDRLHKYATVDGDESNSPLDTPAPRSRAPKPTSYDTSDIEFKARQKAKSRSRSRSPAKKDQGMQLYLHI